MSDVYKIAAVCAVFVAVLAVCATYTGMIARVRIPFHSDLSFFHPVEVLQEMTKDKEKTFERYTPKEGEKYNPKLRRVYWCKYLLRVLIICILVLLVLCALIGIILLMWRFNLRKRALRATLRGIVKFFLCILYVLAIAAMILSSFFNDRYAGYLDTRKETDILKDGRLVRIDYREKKDADPIYTVFPHIDNRTGEKYEVPFTSLRRIERVYDVKETPMFITAVCLETVYICKIAQDTDRPYFETAFKEQVKRKEVWIKDCEDERGLRRAIHQLQKDGVD